MGIGGNVMNGGEDALVTRVEHEIEPVWDEAAAAPARDDRSPTGQRVDLRRTFSAEDKLRILTLASRCVSRGQLSALLRQERICRSQVMVWRRKLALGGIGALSNQRPGPKPTRDPSAVMLDRWFERNARLEAEITLIRRAIALQRKAYRALGLPLPAGGGSKLP
jgi:transposase-like protein